MNKEDLRIVFLGTPDFAAYSLEKIHRAGYNIVGVVTMPDKPAGRGHKMLHSPVKKYAEAVGLRLMQPVKLKDPSFVDKLRSLNADLFIVIAFRMLPEVVWSMPRLGTFNLHASLLPRYRGAAPINRAVMNGDTETGVTTFFLKHEIDTGDVIAQEKIPVGPDDCVGDVHDRLMELGADLTLKTIDDIINDRLETIPQSEMTEYEYCEAPKIFKETCRIDWSRPEAEIHNHVRGLSPYPGAWTTLDGVGDVKIFETARIPSSSALKPGEIAVDGKTMLVGCGDGGAIEIKSVQVPGKRRMSVHDYLIGARDIASGMRFV